MALLDDRESRPVDAARRRRAERQLRHGYHSGALDHDELEERLDAALRATTALELRRATRGLRSPEPQIALLRAQAAGLRVVLGVAAVTWATALAAAGVAWALGAGAVVAAILAVLVTVVYAAATRPVRRRRRVTRSRLDAVRELCG